MQLESLRLGASRLVVCLVLVAVAWSPGAILAAAQAADPADGRWPGPQRVRPADAGTLQARGLRAGTLQRLELPDAVRADMAVGVELDGQAVTLRLRPSALRRAGFRLLVVGGDGIPQVAPSLPSAVVRGHVDEWPGSVVSGSLRNGRLDALVIPGPGAPLQGAYAIEALDGTDAGDATDAADTSGGPGATTASREHLVHRAADLDLDGYTCGVEDVATGAGPGPADDGATLPVFPGSLDATPLMLCEVAADADVEFYQDLGSSVDAVVDHIEAVLASTSAIYEAQLGIELSLLTILVRTEEPDPFFSIQPGPALNQLGNHWSLFQPDWDPDLIQLFTGKNFADAVGYGTLGGVCHETDAVSLVESAFHPSLVVQVTLSAHEFGHNFGASHCADADPDCGIMCPGFCGPLASFGPESSQAILQGKLTKGCLDFAEPLAPPVISGTSPDSYPSAATGGFFTLEGSGLITTFGVDVDGEPANVVFVTGDGSLLVAAPIPDALGPVPVVVHTSVGSSNVGELVYGPNDPPILQAPFSVSVENQVDYLWGGAPGDTAVLLLAPWGITMTVGDLAVLTNAGVAKIAPVNAAALGRYTLPTVPANMVGIQLFSQAVFFDGTNLRAASIVRMTNILP